MKKPRAVQLKAQKKTKRNKPVKNPLQQIYTQWRRVNRRTGDYICGYAFDFGVKEGVCYLHISWRQIWKEIISEVAHRNKKVAFTLLLCSLFALALVPEGCRQATDLPSIYPSHPPPVLTLPPPAPLFLFIPSFPRVVARHPDWS